MQWASTKGGNLDEICWWFNKLVLEICSGHHGSLPATHTPELLWVSSTPMASLA